MSELSVTHTSTVTEDQIDHLGHMNVVYYAVNARAGTDALLAGLGRGVPDDGDVFDVYTRHHREQLLGTALEVRSGVLGADGGSLTIYHELAEAGTDSIAATFVHRVRTVSPVDHLDTVELPPHGRPRSIDLDADPLASAPTLATVRDVGLAMRAPRVLAETDTGATGFVPAHLAPMLIWGGAATDGAEHVLTHVGPNGEAVGWATMETRVGIAEVATLGTRIQSFGATTAVADKTTQMSMWAFDLDTGRLVIAFEVVSVLFDIGARRATSIPDDMRAEHTDRLHPELAPR